MHAAQATSTNEERVTLPGARLLAWTGGIGAACAGAWLAACVAGPWGDATLRTGLIGIGAVTLLAMLGILAINPWKARPVATWMTVWLALTVFRLLGTPVVIFVLYSASSPALLPTPLALSVGIAYMATLFAEALTVSNHLKRTLAI